MNNFPENPEALPPALQELAPAVPAPAPLVEPVTALLLDPPWNFWDLLKLAAVTIVTLLLCMFAVLMAAKHWVYPHIAVPDLALNAVVIVVGEALGYLLVFAYMYFLVTRVCRSSDFFAAVRWNWPANPAPYIFGGLVLSIGLQLFAHLLPIPKNLPIDGLFRTRADAWVLTIFGITLAPLMEELLFRGFLYPVLKRRLGMAAAVLLTALAFALLHGSQLKFAWGPLLVIFLVGLALTIVRAKRDSVAASLLMHIAYNATISALMFAATDGFRHLEKLSSQ